MLINAFSDDVCEVWVLKRKEIYSLYAYLINSNNYSNIKKRCNLTELLKIIPYKILSIR